MSVIDRPVETEMPPDPMDPVTEVLIRARAAIEERGWCRGSFEDGNGAMCAIGALNRAAPGISPVRRAALGRLKMVVGVNSLSMWNDHIAKTKAEVLAAFDHAIDAR